MNIVRSASWGILALHLGCSPSAGNSPGAQSPPASAAATASKESSTGIDPGYVGEELPYQLSTPLSARVEFVGKHGDLRVVSLILPADYAKAAVRELKLPADVADYSYFYVDAPAARVAFALGDDVDIDNTIPSPRSTSNGAPQPVHRIWLLLDEAAIAKLKVDVYFWVGERSVTDEVHVPARSVKAEVHVPELPQAELSGTKPWAASLARYFKSRSMGESSSFGSFADDRLKKEWLQVEESSAGLRSEEDRWERESEVARWMRLGTGYASVEAALQHRAKFGAGIMGTPTRPLTDLRPPELRHHEWSLMLAQLGRKAPALELPKLTPASFYFVAAKDGDSLFTVLDEFDDWGTAALRFIEQTNARSNMLERYLTQLGLSRSGFSRFFGPQAMAEVAWIGSDPYLRRGSDVTLIIRPKNRTLLLAGLETVLAKTTDSLTNVSAGETQIAGQTVKTWSTLDGKLSRYQLEIAGMLVLSNSAAAIDLVIRTAQGKSPALSEEVDFQYMLARDDGLEKGEPDVLGYLGDAFIERTVSPASRVLDARRGIAWSELRRVGNAALLGGYFGGGLTPDSQTLLKAKVLRAEELIHFDGGRIYVPGDRAPFSTWGRAAQMRPLLEVPAPQLVSEEEVSAYEQFRSSYESQWGEVMDPIALRLWVSKDKKKVSAKVRVLPLARSDEYGSILSLAGGQRVEAGEGPAGVRFLFAIGEDSFLRRQAKGLTSNYLGDSSFLDWVGEYAYVGLADTPAVAEALRPGFAPRQGLVPSRELDEAEAALRMPFYASLAIKSRTTASLALAFLNEKFLREESSFEHATLDPYRKLPVWRLSYSDGADRYTLFYSLGERALFFSLSEDVLRELLDREAKGLEPTTVQAASGTPQGRRGAGRRAQGPNEELDRTQFQAALHVIERGGLFTALAWLLDYDSLASRSFLHASEVYGAWGNRGASVTKAFYDYWGEEPITQDGRRFEWTPSGVIDPARGGEFLYRWPLLPDPESHIGKILHSISKISTSLAIDQESPGQEEQQQSLSIGLEVTKR